MVANTKTTEKQKGRQEEGGRWVEDRKQGTKEGAERETRKELKREGW